MPDRIKRVPVKGIWSHTSRSVMFLFLHWGKKWVGGWVGGWMRDDRYQHMQIAPLL